MKIMRTTIGRIMCTVGAYLWQIGGWTGDESYEDLKVIGKIGYHMLCEGIKLHGWTLESFHEHVERSIKL